MGADARKRQKKTEKRNAKRKEKRHELAKRSIVSLADRVERASRAPILECRMTKEIFEQGIGYVTIARRLPDGTVALVLFLLDVFCLGVKDVVVYFKSLKEYDEIIGDMENATPLRSMTPSAARKLIEEAVKYAENLGIRPAPEYRKAELLFGDIDPSICPDEFVFGQEGKPFYHASQFDSNARQNLIIQALTASCGPDGFRYVAESPDLDSIDPDLVREIREEFAKFAATNGDLVAEDFDDELYDNDFEDSDLDDDDVIDVG